jgi:hypothetical protein
MTALQDQIDEVRDSLVRARRLLCEPSAANLQLACGALSAAQKTIEAVRAVAERKGSLDRGLAASITLLRSEIGVIALLLERAASFHANLLERMVAASQTPAPECALRTPTRVLLEA